MPENSPHKPPALRPLIVASAVSIVLLSVFGWMQWMKSPVMDLKPQWLWLAVLPLFVVLVAGQYIGKFKGAGIEFEQYKPDPELSRLPYFPQESSAGSATTASLQLNLREASKPEPSWTTERWAEYERTDSLFLVHAYEPSAGPNQKYDVTIFLIRHRPFPQTNEREGFSEVEKLELYFGPSWNDAVFTAENRGGLVGIRTSAYGTFLATGRVSFKDGRPPVILHRYVDFEMAPRPA